MLRFETAPLSTPDLRHLFRSHSLITQVRDIDGWPIRWQRWQGRVPALADKGE